MGAIQETNFQAPWTLGSSHTPAWASCGMSLSGFWDDLGYLPFSDKPVWV